MRNKRPEGSIAVGNVPLTVTKGLYLVLLGETTSANMNALPPTVFDNLDVRLRIWFNDGVNGFERISPDYRLAPAPYALNASRVDQVLLEDVLAPPVAPVVAWGDNNDGQITVPGLTNVAAIAAGYDHSLALKADGTVEAWGRNDAGQIQVPVGLSNVIAIAAGAYHSLALQGDGTVVFWGWNSGGQSIVTAPIVSITDSTHYQLSQSLPAATNDPTYGGTTVLSSVSDGTRNVEVSDTSGLLVAMTISGPGIAITGTTAIDAGYAYSVALKSDGTLVTWGDNTDGQRTVPVEATQVTAIAAGASHVFALRAPLIPAQVARLNQNNIFTGKIGIRRSPTTNVLEVEGQASKTTAGNGLANSDRRFKTEVETITGALGKLEQIRLVDFRYTEDYLADHPSIEDKRYLNVIAQEFAGVFPDDVKSSGEFLPDGSPILQVDTYPLTIYSAAAIQELHRENKLLKAKLEDQEQPLRKLEAIVNPKCPDSVCPSSSARDATCRHGRGKRACPFGTITFRERKRDATTQRQPAVRRRYRYSARCEYDCLECCERPAEWHRCRRVDHDGDGLSEQRGRSAGNLSELHWQPRPHRARYGSRQLWQLRRRLPRRRVAGLLFRGGKSRCRAPA
ncbi:MAG: hypothetical protein ACJAQT_003136 [Akkermansiaceae bacterium]